MDAIVFILFVLFVVFIVCCLLFSVYTMNWSDNDIEKLINLYEINVFMYDVTASDYHNRHKRDGFVKSAAAAIGTTGICAKNKSFAAVNTIASKMTIAVVNSGGGDCRIPPGLKSVVKVDRRIRWHYRLWATKSKDVGHRTTKSAQNSLLGNTI